MLGFKRKKEKKSQKNKLDEEKREILLTDEQKEELLKTIALKQEKIDQVSREERSKIYEEIGLAFFELDDEDHAIEALEKSIQLKKSVGDGYKTLLRLYNKKRAQAARENDDSTLQIYLNKMDEMMKVSKDVTRGAQ